MQHNVYQIKDERVFDKNSFSQYPKNAVFHELNKSLLQSNYETTCHWVAEIDCSEWQELLWEKLIIFSGKYIHIHNPFFPIFLMMRYKQYLELSNKSK